LYTVYAILGLAAIIGLVVLWDKAKEGMIKAANRKIFHRSEYEEGQRMLAGLTMETTAGIHDVMQQLQAQVVALDAPLGIRRQLHLVSQQADRIQYAFGNKLTADVFTAVVALSVRDGITVGIFAIPSWQERGGMISGQESMRTLRKQVKSAFKSADASARFTAGLIDDRPREPVGGQLGLVGKKIVLVKDFPKDSLYKGYTGEVIRHNSDSGEFYTYIDNLADQGVKDPYAYLLLGEFAEV